MEAIKPSCTPAVRLPADWQRYLPPRAVRSAASRLDFAALLALFFIAHAGLIATLLYEDRFGLQTSAQMSQEEIPVEVVVLEPPKEEPKPPPPLPPRPKEQPRQAKEDFEKPATSAPRRPAETLDTKGIEEKTAAPQPLSKPRDGESAPAASSPAPASAAPTMKATLDASSDAPDAEAIGKAGPEHPGKPDDKETRAERKALTNTLQQLSATTLSDFSFGRTTKAAPITGGLEDNRYLANVFAKIMSKKQNPRGFTAAPTKRYVTISFVLDDSGRIVYQATSKSSGDPAIDSAAAAAVRSGAPYPPPPYGLPHSLIANIEF
ncbi:MAG: TonB family protein [Methylobacteriaceae bacterium]|nr:TonB family protein [Methylobacteriaceae bacterium]MBV9394829.1 TonB family protein [Methylobacteriaceae bacterium]